MTRSTTSFHFPDVNVWLALSYQSHAHHGIAVEWFDSLPDSSRLCFCRITQLALLRLLTTEQIMGDEALTQRQAWSVYDSWLEDDRVVYVDEPPTLETRFRSLTQSQRPNPKEWPDSYLAAFAESAGFQIVTFDKGLRRRASGAILLSSE